MEGAKIYPAIANVMAEIGAVGKNKRNQQQGFLYRGVDDVMNAINPALTKNKVFVVPEVMDCTRENRTTSKGNPLIYSVAKIRYTFFAEDGSNVQAIVIGEGMDSGDKSMNKAMSIAFKYACFQVFCIPTEEMADPDAECHEVAPANAPQRQQDRQAGSRQGRGSSNARQQAPPADPSPDPQSIFVGPSHIAVLRKEMDRCGVSEDAVLAAARVGEMSEITIPAFKSLMKKFEKTPTRPPAAPDDMIPEVPADANPDEMGLPFV